MKMYKCKFCTRTFCNSQALGGHQNSHRKERDAVKRYCKLTINHHSDHLLDSAGTPRGDGDRPGFARLTDNGSGYGPGSVQAGVDLNSYEGSYYPQVVAVNWSDPDSLDLNLKL
ncbi:hypothetical protein SSX86_022440 [Deinandra increscens subsp. villosa]|uniref:C2H2-type domain-containing protein n=1 Tax=Deinandra increscens subsp. villosa TaxID=3103831 RepID=A0AAP0CIU1_9ASTR